MAKSSGSNKGIKTEPEPPAGRMGDHYLLAIAINEYKSCLPLSNCVQDAEELIAVLQNQYRFDPEHTITLFEEQATRRNILKELDGLSSRVGGNDSLLIYFSGHGEIRRNIGYWVPVEAEPDYVADFISSHDIINHLDAIPSLHTLLVVDACFGGSIFSGAKKVLQLPKDFTRASRYGLASSHSRETASDGLSGEHSPFSLSLIQELKRNSGPLRISELAPAVAAEVKRRTKEQQNAVFRPLDVKGDDQGIFVFFPRQDASSDWVAAQAAHTAAAFEQFAAKHPESPNAEAAWWQRALLLVSVEGYDDYLERYPEGRFASQALKALEQTEEDAFWRAAQQRDSLAEYRKYLNKYPSGRYRSQAMARIGELRGSPSPTIAASTQASPAPPTEPKLPFPLPEMVFVKAGTFTMGWKMERDGEGYDDEKPAHEVTVKDFYIGKYPVTQAQWRAVMGSDPPELHNKGCDNCPVERVSWNDIKEFLTKLNILTGKRYRLPTEAEWEYAARGGNQSRGFLYSGSNAIDEVAWYSSNSGSKTRPVGGKKPNELGLYDMSGNVWEWCEDDWHSNYNGAPTDGSAWVDSPRASDRVNRGGGWIGTAQYCRASFRNNYTPSYRYDDLGFRLAL